VAEALARSYAFDAYAGRDVGPAQAGAGVSIHALRMESMVLLRGNAADPRFLSEASAALGVMLPVEPNTATGVKARRALWLGPDEWLIASLRDRLGEARVIHGTITDVSHGRAVLRLCGREARAVLAKGCALDLDMRAFPPNACAQTAIAKMNIAIDHATSGAFDLYCARSYAGSFWDWITEAAAEYGCNVELEQPPRDGPTAATRSQGYNFRSET
jgi:sarcosine oxidase subunit gamma